MADPSSWSSLEVAKLVVDGLTPVAVVLLGVWVARAIRRVEESVGEPETRRATHRTTRGYPSLSQ